MKRKTTEEFIKEANQRFNNTFDYSKTKYTGATNKVIITCSLHGDFEQRPNDHLCGKGGCKECSKVNKHTPESFKEKATVKHKNYYDYSQVTFSSIHDKIIIVCPHHGDFLQTGREHLAGSGCRKCAAISTAKQQTKPLELFIKQANEVHSDKYSYLNVIYKNNAEKICIECKEHGSFWQAPNDHLKGRGCPDCGQTLKKENYRNKKTTLYFVRFSNDVYKIGLCRTSIQYRFRGCKKPKIIQSWEFADGALAFEAERKILKVFKQYKYVGKLFINNYNTSCGESECFIENINNEISILLNYDFKNNYITKEK